MQYLELVNLTVCYGKLKAIDNLSLGIEKEELFTFLGPSGSGKSTILLTIAGFLNPSQGKIILEGDDITDIPANKRNVGMVFQSYVLFPHMTVFGNIAFPLKVRKRGYKGIRNKIKNLLKLFGLEGLERRYPNELSGGEQQRVALARALSFEPKILLLDEPLGSLDKKLREYMQIEIKRLQKDLKTTVLHVTHDQSEALTISDRIAILRNGKIEQIGSPENIYKNPETEFVANFIGESNFLRAEILDYDEFFLKVLLFGEHKIKIPAPKQFNRNWHSCHLMIRPENFQVHSEVPKSSFAIPATIDEIIYLGDFRRIRLSVKYNLKISIKDYDFSQKQYKIGQKVYLRFDTKRVKVFGSSD